MRNYVVKGQDRHLDGVIGRLREADRQELVASNGCDPDEVLKLSWLGTVHRWAVFHRGEVAGLFGVSGITLLGNIGVPWLLGTDMLDEMKFFFIRNSRRYVRKMLDLYPRLLNFVDARNTRSIEWLRWCGFKMFDSAPYGVEGRPFIRFELERKDYV